MLWCSVLPPKTNIYNSSGIRFYGTTGLAGSCCVSHSYMDSSLSCSYTLLGHILGFDYDFRHEYTKAKFRTRSDTQPCRDIYSSSFNVTVIYSIYCGLHLFLWRGKYALAANDTSVYIHEYITDLNLCVLSFDTLSLVAGLAFKCIYRYTLIGACRQIGNKVFSHIYFKLGINTFEYNYYWNTYFDAWQE